MSADRITKAGPIHKLRSEVLAHRFAAVVEVECQKAAARFAADEWYPTFEGEAICAARNQRAGSPYGSYLWGAEYARDDDGKVAAWAATRRGLAQAVAWCEKKNGGGV